MGLVAWGDLERGGIHLDEIPAGEESPQGRLNPVAAQEERAAVGMDMGRPPGGRGGHGGFQFQRLS